nr:MAG TPA: hypothetical protein [Caudoviricetes sp.]
MTENSCCIVLIFSVSLNHKLNSENLILTKHIYFTSYTSFIFV